jgi:hypothetical protein
LALNLDGKYSLTGSGSLCFCEVPAEDNTVQLCDVETGEILQVLVGHNDTDFFVDITPGGRWGISGSITSEAIVLDLENGRWFGR